MRICDHEECRDGRGKRYVLLSTLPWNGCRPTCRTEVAARGQDGELCIIRNFKGAFPASTLWMTLPLLAPSLPQKTPMFLPTADPTVPVSTIQPRHDQEPDTTLQRSIHDRRSFLVPPFLSPLSADSFKEAAAQGRATAVPCLCSTYSRGPR